MISEEQVTAAMQAVAHTEQGKWFFNDSPYPHSEKSVRQTVRLHLLLRVEPISDILTPEMFLSVAERLVALEEAIRDPNAHQRVHGEIKRRGL